MQWLNRAMTLLVLICLQSGCVQNKQTVKLHPLDMQRKAEVKHSGEIRRAEIIATNFSRIRKEYRLMYGEISWIETVSNGVCFTRIQDGMTNRSFDDVGTQSIEGLMISHSGKYIAAYTSDAVVCLWNCDNIFQRAMLRLMYVDEKMMNNKQVIYSYINISQELPDSVSNIICLPKLILDGNMLTTNGWVAVQGSVGIDGNDIVGFKSIRNQDGYYGFEFTLDEQATELFSEVTENYIGDRIAFIYRGCVISMPTIAGKIPYGKGEIIGPVLSILLPQLEKVFTSPAKLRINLNSDIAGMEFAEDETKLLIETEDGWLKETVCN